MLERGPPRFWRHDAAIVRILAPLGTLTAWATRRRLQRAGWQAPIPVICCGNATVGGAGKTTLALDLGRRLIARGKRPHFLTRGYGGRIAGPHRVDPMCDSAATIGDEPLLLAAVAPTWVAADRAAGARAAIAAGAELLVMDDGLQNPTLRKTLSLLVIDGATGFGNRRLLPAGPLREPIAAAAARCAAAVMIGTDLCNAAAQLPPHLPLLTASLRQSASPGGKIIAFAGIAHPAKFWSTLEATGADIAAKHAFPDHHPYSDAELAHLVAEARGQDAQLVTTPKDAVRLPKAIREQTLVVDVDLIWDDPRSLEQILSAL